MGGKKKSLLTAAFRTTVMQFSLHVSSSWRIHQHLCSTQVILHKKYFVYNLNTVFTFFFNFYLFGCPRSQLQQVGFSSLYQGLNLGPLRQECGVPTTEPLAKFLMFPFYTKLLSNLRFPKSVDTGVEILKIICKCYLMIKLYSYI